MQLQDQWVLVTGASSGLGEAIAVELATRHRAKPILVARRAGRLHALASKLKAEAGVAADVIEADLSKPEDVERVYQLATRERSVYAAILNAGITHFGDHRELDFRGFETMLATNVTSNVRLCSLFIPHLIETNQGGGLLLVTSMAGLVTVPYQTAYSATKAFLTSYGQGLYHEHAGDNLSITTFAPGGIDTDMVRRYGLTEHFGKLQTQDPKSCAHAAIDAMIKRRYLAVPGTFNQLPIFMSRLVSRKISSGAVASAYRGALRNYAKSVAPAQRLSARPKDSGSE
ncbi:MAG: SDR family NAD(P)-dependent oxidoreductase [Polyangiaceae bacterium]